MTRDHALLAVELVTRLGTTPALRAAFAPVVWRARAALAGGAAGTVEGKVLDRTTAGPRQEPGRAFFEHGVDTVTDLIRPIVGARQVSRRREAI